MAYPYKEKRQLTALIGTLRSLVERDPEQEVMGIALPVLDAVVGEVRKLFPEDPLVQATIEVISPEQIALGEPIRAADALLVAEQLKAVIGPAPLVVG